MVDCKYPIVRAYHMLYIVEYGVGQIFKPTMNLNLWICVNLPSVETRKWYVSTRTTIDVLKRHVSEKSISGACLVIYDVCSTPSSASATQPSSPHLCL